MIDRKPLEQRAVTTPGEDEAIILSTKDGWVHQTYPTGAGDDPDFVPHNLVSSNPATGERVVQQVELPRSRIIEAKEFIIRHKKGEIVTVASMGAIVVGSLFVRKIHKKTK